MWPIRTTEARRKSKKNDKVLQTKRLAANSKFTSDLAILNQDDLKIKKPPQGWLF